MSASITPALFRSIKIGDITLSHRVVLAPQGRYRADSAHVPTDLMAQYYGQRASVPGTLLISEATLIIAQAGGIPHLPGLWSDAQVAGWKKASVLQILLLGVDRAERLTASCVLRRVCALGDRYGAQERELLLRSIMGHGACSAAGNLEAGGSVFRASRPVTHSPKHVSGRHTTRANQGW